MIDLENTQLYLWLKNIWIPAEKMQYYSLLEIMTHSRFGMLKKLKTIEQMFVLLTLAYFKPIGI